MYILTSTPCGYELSLPVTDMSMDLLEETTISSNLSKNIKTWIRYVDDFRLFGKE